MASSAKSNGGRGVSWRERETLDLIAIWGEQKVQEALGARHRNIDVYEKISEEMAARGHNRNALECRTKSKGLRKDYKRAVLNYISSGNSRKECPYFNELHRIFCGDASITPVCVSRSLDQRVVFDSPEEIPEVIEVSEEEFSQELPTINMADIRSSSPIPLGHDPCPDSQNAIAEPDDTLTTNDAQQDPPNELTQQEQTSSQPQVTASPNEDSNSEASGAPQPSKPGGQPPLDGKGVNARNRMRRVSVLNDVARQMLRQCAQESQSAQLRHEELMAAEERSRKREDRRYERLLEEVRLDREAFSVAMDRSTEAILSAVDAIRYLCDLQRSRGQPKENESSDLTESQENRQHPNKRACVGKRRERLDL